jgi:CheY-like chemotaxis protein/HPt (histidine-containing phosphotransfer) domain-containing protein
VSGNEAQSEFEARLLALKHKMERGLVDRARTLRAMADRLDGGDQSARREIKTESHKLRGVAGSYGHNDLTELAAQLEQRASVSPPATVTALTRSLADLAESKGRNSLPPPPRAPAALASAQPVAPSQPAASLPRSSAPQGSSARPREGKPLRVLAMDDDLVTQRLLQLTLAQVGGFDAIVVGSAAAALDLLQRETFDVVLSDAMMPDMNGRDFRRAARAAGASMPIVILSAAGADELGWDDPSGPGLWLRKPFKPTALVRDIERIVADHRKR